jgi:hypothetical protein
VWWRWGAPPFEKGSLLGTFVGGVVPSRDDRTAKLDLRIYEPEIWNQPRRLVETINAFPLSHPELGTSACVLDLLTSAVVRGSQCPAPYARVSKVCRSVVAGRLHGYVPSTARVR